MHRADDLRTPARGVGIIAMHAGDPRFLALGDSYTIGEGVGADEGWPAQLTRRLQARGIAISHPQIVAQTGWTTDELAAAMDAARFTPPYALVSVSIGVNNQYRGRDLVNYRDELATLLERARVLAGGDAGRVIVVSIPDWGVTGFARAQGRDAARVAAEIDAFNAVAHERAAAAGMSIVDVTALSREAGDDAASLVADGLHPSAAQYALWSDTIMVTAARVLGASIRA